MARILLAITLIFFLFAENSFALPSRKMTVFAEPNMVEALTKISRLYSQQNNVIVSINFSSSADFINEIDLGEPADLFISAHADWIEILRQKGLVDVYNTGYIARDELVLVTGKSNTDVPAELRVKKIALPAALTILNHNKASLILDYEGNSSGQFSHALIQNLALTDLQLFDKLQEDRAPILNQIKDHPQAYALLLASQVKDDPSLQILATQKDQNIFYQSLVIAGDNMEIARKFLKFLKSDTAKTIMKESGFIVD
jgi:molybdate transport system substrate-binding protein